MRSERNAPTSDDAASARRLCTNVGLDVIRSHDSLWLSLLLTVSGLLASVVTRCGGVAPWRDEPEVSPDMGNEFTRTARDVAAVMGWQIDTVYRNRSRTLQKLATGKRVLPTDLPPGTLVGRELRWSDAELRRFVNARKRSNRRGGRPRGSRTRAATRVAPDRGAPDRKVTMKLVQQRDNDPAAGKGSFLHYTRLRGA